MIVPENVFVDTNILAYAYDLDAGEKRKTAKALVIDLWRKPFMPFISVQVLQEFYVTMQKKDVSLDDLMEIVEELLTWQIVENTVTLFRQATINQKRFQLSFWDASILSAAIQSHCSILYSEDLNHGQNYDSVTVQNPFLLDTFQITSPG